MSFTLAVLVLGAAIGLSSAASDCAIRKASYEWAARSIKDTSFVKKEKNMISVDESTKALSWNLEFLKNATYKTIDLKVLGINENGSWKELQDIKNGDLCSHNSEGLAVYSTLLGFQNSEPALQLPNGQSTIECSVKQGKLSLQNFLPSASELDSPALPLGKQIVYFNFKIDNKSILTVSFKINVYC